MYLNGYALEVLVAERLTERRAEAARQRLAWSCRAPLSIPRRGWHGVLDRAIDTGSYVYGWVFSRPAEAEPESLNTGRQSRMRRYVNAEASSCQDGAGLWRGGDKAALGN